MWQNPSAENAMDWESAKQYCTDLELASYTDWSLPSVGKLRSLIRGCPPTEPDGSCNVEEGKCLGFTCMNDACEGCFDEVKDDCYWSEIIEGECGWYMSSSPMQELDGEAWQVSFWHAVIYPNGGDMWGLVRCVR